MRIALLQALDPEHLVREDRRRTHLVKIPDRRSLREVRNVQSSEGNRTLDKCIVTKFLGKSG
ncbi:MAG: hypothetical protein DMG68_03945 [Acidobacteria bacterium]|nr:MAG: hypothetical protein DMG68_03945 [Acidobacteriota bacterium]